METRTLAYVAQKCGGILRHGSPAAQVSGIATDSRQARPGQLFIALAGERFDGHEFLSQAVKNGAGGLLVQRGRGAEAQTDVGVIEVDDTRSALARLASCYRHDFSLPVVAIGGSNGKTTTKELIASVLRQRFKTLWSEASFNNDVGVPITLLRLETAHQVAVLEVGTNHPGEIAPLVRLLQPRYGVLTSIGREHLEFFGDLQGVAQEEGWLAELLPADGKFFVNLDSPEVERVIRRSPAPVVTVGTSERAEWLAQDIRMDAAGTSFQVRAPRNAWSGEYRLQLLGRHQVTNALLALAVGAELGLGREELRSGLLACQPPKSRMQSWESGGLRILDDAYNANADSMNAALQTLREIPVTGRRVAVLGDMGELGASSEAAHAEVGRSAARAGVQQLFAVGRMAGVMASAARGAGLSGVEIFPDAAAAAAALKLYVQPGDVILIKASRLMRLERVGAVLRGEMMN